MKRIFKSVSLAMLLATSSQASFAQGQGQQQMPMTGWGMRGNMMGQGMMGWGMQGMGPGMMGPGMMGPGMMGPGGGEYRPMMEGRLAYTKAELGITDAQEAAWKEYVTAVKARADTMQSMRQTMMQTMQSGTAIERMKAHVAAMQSMLESMNALVPATEALYAALSDDQKKKADLLLGGGCCMM